MRSAGHDGFPLISIGERVDTDSDGIPDECEVECLATGMLADDDDDNDGVLDVNDAYPRISVAGLVDTDADGAQIPSIS